MAGAPGASNGAITANPDVQLFVEPEDGTAPVLRELNSAAHSLDVAMYLLTDKPAISALEAAQRRGVQVRVLLEQHPYGDAAGNNAVFAQLQRAGVAVRWADPTYKLTHEKAIGIDRRETLILTLNLTASAFSRNREYGVVDRAPGDVAEMEGLFEADWNRTTYQPLQPDLVVSPVNARARLLHLIGAAGRELDVESEEVQDRALEDALAAAAHRGVHVRLVISPASSGRDANAPGLARVKAGGVQVRELSRPYIHAKIFLADGAVAFVGSENISTASLDGNRELGVFVNSPAALQRMASTFQQDWDARG